MAKPIKSLALHFERSLFLINSNTPGIPGEGRGWDLIIFPYLNNGAFHCVACPQRRGFDNFFAKVQTPRVLH